MKPMLKPHGTKHLKLKCDKLLSTFPFKFNLRRFSAASWLRYSHPRQELTTVHFSAQPEPLFVTDATATVHLSCQLETFFVNKLRN